MSSVFEKESGPYERRKGIANHVGCGIAYLSRTCGVFVCTTCGEHEGLARCFCGWSLSGRSGYQELIEMGEQIEEDY